MEYGVLKENYISCEGESYISYGIRCINTGREVSDVTTNYVKITEFVELLNKENLDEIHLMDVVEDFLDELI